MACTDLKDAYKMLPVCLEQRKLQAFKLCGAVFIDMKLIFGDKVACMYFDRFHHCFLEAFVYPSSPMHRGAQGRTVDDVTTVVPACARQSLVEFVQNYRVKLQSIGGEAAEDDGSGLIAETTSTLEALGLLVPLSIYPHRFVGREVHTLIDNLAVVSGFQKRRSNDRLADTIIRAARLVAGALDCRLFVSWIGRRSTRSACIADDLTHVDFSSTLHYDSLALTMFYEDFPPPISKWMERAVEYRDLGHDIIKWIKEVFPDVI